jgi:hypothetical protein
MIDSEAIYLDLNIGDICEFGELFSSSKKSAFRLELLDLYTVPEEEPYFKNYLSSPSIAPPLDFNSDWKSMLEDANNRGVEYSRARVVRQPVTDYLKFEISWGYSESIKLGEDIRAIITDGIVSFNTEVPFLKDFWLFDDEHCFIIEYDYIGKFLGVRRIPPMYTQLYVQLKEEAISKSTRIETTDIWRLLT